MDTPSAEEKFHEETERLFQAAKPPAMVCLAHRGTWWTPWWMRLGRWLFPGRHCWFHEPDWSDDMIIVRTQVKLGRADRWRILLSGRFEVVTAVAVENPPGRTEAVNVTIGPIAPWEGGRK
jgi:hypothetical protein